MNNKPGIVKEGWLRRLKTQKRRYFVLCFNKDSGAAQLQYYDNEKKFNSKLEPKRTIYLRDCLGIIGKEDPKFGHVLVLYTKEEVFSVITETQELLQSWLNDLDKLHKMENKNLQDSKYDLVWNVTVIPRGLGGVKNMTGCYKLCLKDETLLFVHPVSQEVLNEEKLCHIRRYGHMDYCFFMEFGRSTTLGAGEIWMEVEDPLIAQKIHEALSRSVKPSSSADSGDTPDTIPKKSKDSKTNRHSMVDPIANNNNNGSPKPRRLTFFSAFTKKKETSRLHSNSISVVQHAPVQQGVAKRLSHVSPYMNQPMKNGQESEEEGLLNHLHITPPVPSIPRKISKPSLHDAPSENIPSRNDKKGTTGADTKSLNEASVKKPNENEYTNVKPPVKRRSVGKQDCAVVRRGYADEQRRSRSLPRRPSASSSERQRHGSNKSGHGGEESDKDGGRVSDDDERRHSLELPENHYLNMNPIRPRIISDSSSEEPSPYAPVCPSGPVDHYIKMRSPRHTPNLSASRLSARSSDSAEEPAIADNDSGHSPYINMAPVQNGQWRHARMGSSSNESTEDGRTADEIFDHLDREESINGGDSSQSRSNDLCYVHMSQQPADSGGLKKSRSNIQRKTTSDYVNVNISRSRSTGSKTLPPRPLFQIVSEQSPRPSSDDEISRHPASNYVNMRTSVEPSTSDPNLQNAYFVPILKADSEGRKTPTLNYASVDFSEGQAATTNLSHRTSFPGRKSPSNYSKIDFQKSKGLAEISSSRERQLHGIH